MEYNCKPSKISRSVEPEQFWGAAAQRRDAMDYTPWSESERQSLLDFARRVEAPEAVAESIDALGDPKTLVVCAGQQTGLFLSPMYILYKAAGAILWARELEHILGRPVRPLFWIASEDHDFDEIRTVKFQGDAGELHSWQYPAEAPAGQSMFDIAVESNQIEAFMEQVRAQTRETEFRESVIARWMEHAEIADNLEEFFARGLMDFFGDAGLIPLSSRNAALRQRAAGVLRREIEQPGWTSRSVKDSADHAIHRHGDEVNFFLYRDGRRAKVRVDDGHFKIESIESNALLEKLSPNAMLKELEASPEHFSPNVITRPVVQDAALPVIAMLGGPGERRYLAQLRESGMYDFFKVPSSVILERPRALLLAPGIEKSLEKSGLDESLLKQENVAALREAAAHLSNYGTALEAVEQLESKADALFLELEPSLGDLLASPAVESALRKTLQNWKSGANKMAQRVQREIEQRDEASLHHVERIAGAMLPDGKPQERVLGPLAPFSLHYGTAALSDFILQNLRIDCTDELQLLRLSTIPKER